MSRNLRLHTSLAALVLSVSSAGCTTDAYCFRNCGDDPVDAAADGAGGGAGYGGGSLFDGGQGGTMILIDAGGNSDACKATNGGIEICDGLDNNCNGKVDDGFAFDDPKHCGTCQNNCFTLLLNADLTTISCEWDGTPGKEGTCKFAKCSQDYFDTDPAKPGCEYYCIKIADDDSSCNNRDDDCDKLVDEDVNLCTSVTDCGKCGGSCVVLHGMPECQHPSQGPCDTTNTKCAVKSCDDVDSDGSPDWWDLDNSYATGCEYQCSRTNGGVEICGDGLDNDCDGRIDGADDDLTGDPQLGQPCFGDMDGECATQAHAGLTSCVGQKVTCTGPNIIVQGQNPEKCNQLDDDCDGVSDNNLTDVGANCGKSGIFPCRLGTEQCVGGTITCIGAIEPGVEICNGFDDDCNAAIDDNTVDAAGSCGQSDQGACQLGSKACVGGVIQCQGNVEPTLEVCNGLDDDCNGQADDNLTDTGASCGAVGISPCKLGTIQCDSGTLKCIGKIDPSSELCNGIDDDCNGKIDDNVPNAGTACGLSNTFPCTKGSMQCVAGNMVCVGAIDPKPETCNGIDDDCDGSLDDSTTDSGGSCGLSSKAPCQLGTLTCQAGVLACVGNTDPKAESCNGVDDDCDGTVDDSPSGVGTQCGQSSKLPCKLGVTACDKGKIVCSGAIEPGTETCNGIDDDCDGTVDDNAQGTGESCGTSNVAPCALGSKQCQGGQIVCVGALNPATETCNGVDDDCDGFIDKTGVNSPGDSTGACNVPKPPPAGATSPCKAGTKACTAGVVQCVGSIGPTGPNDTCGVDANCDGVLTNQPNQQTDVSNCGACGNNCLANNVHGLWACAAGACAFQGCESGYFDLNNDKKCEYACTYLQAQEICNGIDDNCNGQVDESLIAPSPTQICGVNPAATRPECTSQVTVSCQAGSWKCIFPANVCSPSCATTAEVCDGLDNDCDGVMNENVANYGKPCASDDGLPPPGHGACRVTGTYECNGSSATVCSANKADCNSLPGGCTEACDGIDNDCDGAIDETFNAKGANATHFVKPVATKISATRWIYSFEASRPTANSLVPGTGNGYWTSAPAGNTMDKTVACSVAEKIPWFNVTPTEAEQTCTAMGGFVCTTAEWSSACQATQPCTWGYNPRGTSCTTAFAASKYCNLGPYDFVPGLPDNDGLLPTGSPLLQNCWADWANLQDNTTSNNKIFDITGNLREITKTSATDYRLMGGAFNTSSDQGATCTFNFYSVTTDFKLFDAGFRCCFSADPSL